MKKLPMNLPNRITIARILLIPVYLLLMTLDADPNWLAAIVFAVAACTDWIDGRIARSRGLITDFGKFMDPIADKLLVLAPMILFVSTDMINVWAVIIMVSREIVVSGFRLVAVTKGNVIAAGWTGKVKTTLQMLAIMALTLGIRTLGTPLVWLSTIASVYSGWEIIWKNRVALQEAE